MACLPLGGRPALTLRARVAVWPASGSACSPAAIAPLSLSLRHARRRGNAWPGGRAAAAVGAGVGTTAAPAAPKHAGGTALHGPVERGSPEPLGATLAGGAVNFALASYGATAVTLCLFASAAALASGTPTEEITLDSARHRTGAVWHAALPALAPGTLYGYRVSGPMLPESGHRYDASAVILDPYATAVVSRPTFGVGGAGGERWAQHGGAPPVASEPAFDWQGDAFPNHRAEDLVIYEMHVRGFTQGLAGLSPGKTLSATRPESASAGVRHPGTYLGVIEKLPYLTSLGVNAIELLPVHEFNELETGGPLDAATHRASRLNFWGYSTVCFFSPMARYAAGAGPRDAVRELKTLVRECHKAGIEVILDVVFNHTAEGNEAGPTLSFRGLDNKAWYMVAPAGQFYNYSGCGNTLAANHPAVRAFITDCLAYWVAEFHVDGFRFDLASVLTRSAATQDAAAVTGAPGAGPALGTPLADPPLLEMLSQHGILRGRRLIAEAWDAAGLYQVGSFPHHGVWAEWNGKYRDAVRSFIRGADGSAGAFAHALCGSPDTYGPGGRRPRHSVNFVTAHDGFSLMDLVSYNQKSNEANGESNRDGEADNNSWNCGTEGGPAPPPVARLRQRQARNFLLALAVSQGVPMITMGDEIGHTKGGNNNTYCHDTASNYLDWAAAGAESGPAAGLRRFATAAFALRRAHAVLRRDAYPDASVLTWHGETPGAPDWAGKLVAFELRDSSPEFIFGGGSPAAGARRAAAEEAAGRVAQAATVAAGTTAVTPAAAAAALAGERGGERLYVAFNASHLPRLLTLPPLPSGLCWTRALDTSLPCPYDAGGWGGVGGGPDAHATAAAVADAAAPLLRENCYALPSYSAAVLVATPEVDGLLGAAGD